MYIQCCIEENVCGNKHDTVMKAASSTSTVQYNNTQFSTEYSKKKNVTFHYNHLQKSIWGGGARARLGGKGPLVLPPSAALMYTNVITRIRAV